jgi:phage-related protein
MVEFRTKPVEWMGSSLDDVRDFPAEARSGIGRELRRVQTGLAPHDFKPMATVGPGVSEIRIRGKTAHRLIYVAKYEEAVYVLHAFEKRSRKTPRREIEIAQRRLAEVLRRRQDRK